MTIQISEERYTENPEVSGRRLITSSSAFGIIRKQLAENIGVGRIRGFLFRYGWEMGAMDAEEAMKTESSVENLVKEGPLLHIGNGHITGMDHKCTIKYGEDGQLHSVYGRGKWVNSYEAYEHIKRLGLSDEPVCHTLIGYASGFMSTVFGESLYAKELECVGKGDQVCRWEVKTERQWAEENQAEHNHLQEETTIVEELEFTYEQLLEQQKVVTKLSDFQKRLTEEIANGSDLLSIAEITYRNEEIPIVVEDRSHRTLAVAGLSEEEDRELKEDMLRYLAENQPGMLPATEGYPVFFRKKIIRTELQERLVTPILVQKEVIGYCSFVYDPSSKHNKDEDYLFLDRFANAASLLLLNEKTKFESFERMKGSFLEQILENKLSAEDIIKRGKYTGIDLEQPYYITVMSHKTGQRTTIEEEFYQQEQMLEKTFRYFSEKKQNLLIGHLDGHMVLLKSANACKPTIDETIREYWEFISKEYPQSEFRFGISNRGENIRLASKAYREARMAERLAIKKQIVPFRSLGVVGMLVSPEKLDDVKIIAAQELGPLYNLEDPKMLELLRTLHAFLSNGGKLEKTMTDLALSMSGLRHRIQRIESLLEKDLRNPNEAHQLLVILQSLIALGELETE
ncbi:hypothetical protein AV656_08855 [Bhargavaea cecembensis]|uniref:4-vinyl reductase 4VR domain-containing protein n=1 Tax=Bhargavaea cecembensis TaxID=394098 RepID=A0A163FNR5_9BACL|nr:V4R domain-containing protein [Bhargavaea cecembensis]KZE38996.1 hypothetical protein AV656_08855 [Bhargavaea cecembensis]